MSVNLGYGDHVVEHVLGTPATCHDNGIQEHWYCELCATHWADEELRVITNANNVIIPALGGEVEHVEAVEATCMQEGNLEYWHCVTENGCGKYWADEELRIPTTALSVQLGLGDHNITHVDANPATCTEDGNLEYWHCDVCECFWLDEELKVQVAYLSTIIPAIGNAHEWGEYVVTTEPTCAAPGVETRECDLCHATESREFYPDEPVAHSITKIDKVAPGCHYKGNIEYWYCDVCECFWADEALTQQIAYLSTIVDELGGEVEHVEAKAPTCYEEGNIEYWHCVVEGGCDKYWADEARTQLINRQMTILAPAHTKVAHMKAVDPGCHYEGNIEYWICNDCGAVATDELFREITNIKNVVLPEIGGEVEHVEAKAATCYEEGNIEYWHCVVEGGCDKYWADEARTQLINRQMTIVGATGEHTFVDGVCSVCGELEEVEHVHETTHTPAVDPGCHYLGNVEYWYCAGCDCYFLDEECTLVTNYLSTIRPEIGGEVEHVEAKAATCVEDGNIEYWHCVTENGCDKYWADEARTQLINRQMTIVGATGEHTFVDGVCSVCGESEELVNPFIDVKDGQWYTEAILYCYYSGLMEGTGETEEGKIFSYKGVVDRQQFATILAAIHTKLTGETIPEYTAEEMSFSDVEAGKWYSNAIEWAYQNGYAAGTGVGADGKPVYTRKTEVTREQLAQFFYTYAKLNGYVAEDYAAPEFDAKYTDVDRIHSWALDAMAWAVDVELISGTSETTLSPRDSATRAQIAVIIEQYVEGVIAE